MEISGIWLCGWLAFRNLAAVAVVLVAACAAPPDSPSSSQFQSHQTQLLTATFQKVTAESVQQRRIFFVGLALYSEDWSENDVVDLGQQLSRVATSFIVVPLIFSDSINSQPDKYPIFSLDVLALTAATIARHSRADDLVVVYVSTHGSSGALAQKLGTHSLSPVTGFQLAEALAPLADRKTIILLSACFSGSLIPNLRAPYRHGPALADNEEDQGKDREQHSTDENGRRTPPPRQQSDASESNQEQARPGVRSKHMRQIIQVLVAATLKGPKSNGGRALLNGQGGTQVDPAGGTGGRAHIDMG